MRCRLSLLVVLVFVASPEWVSGQTSDVIRLPWTRWSFHIGNSQECAAPTNSACVWQSASAPPPILPVDMWQRVDLQLPDSLRTQQQLGVLIQGKMPVYEVFVNGQDIGGSGSFQSRNGPQDARTILVFPANLAADGRMSIAIHALNLRTSLPIGGFIPALGPVGQLEIVKNLDTLAYVRSNWQHYLCYLTLCFAGLVFLLLFTMEREFKEYLWIGVQLCSLASLRFVEFASVGDLGMSAKTAFVIFIGINASASVVYVEFAFAFLGQRVWKIFRLVQIVGLLYGIQFLLLLPVSYSAFLPLQSAVAAFTYAMRYSAVLQSLALLPAVPMCFRSRLPEMRAIGAAFLFMSFEETNRYLTQQNLPSLPQNIRLGTLDFDLRALAFLIFAVVMLVAMTVRFRRIQSRNHAIEQEFAAARTVQQVLIPDFLPPVSGLTIESVYLPAQEVGGDFFQVLPIPGGGDAFIVVGDVSGKGLKAAMTVSLLVGTLRTYAEFYTTPTDLLAGLNRRLHGRGDSFATCLVLKITPAGDVTIANAGHPNPYLDGLEIPTESDLPLGLTLDVAYAETHLSIGPSQCFALVTDGVVEATAPATRELFGFERTRAISTQTASAIAEAACLFGRGAPQADDITVLTVTRVAAEVPQAA
jgi:phosphoserine phosphatase RsbU/P